MNILHIIASVNPVDGGPIEGIVQQSRYVGHERHVACLDEPGAPFLLDCGVKVFALGKTRGAAWRRQPWIRYGYSPYLLPWLRKNIRQYDVVVVNGLWNYAAFAARRALVGSGVPYVVFTHGMLDPWFKRVYPVKSVTKQISWWFCEGPLLRHANKVLFTTQEEMALARNSFWPYELREKVVSYGTADIQGEPDRQRRKFHALVPRLRQRPYFLFLSRIHPKKGCDLLIEAFVEVARLNEDTDLVIAGPDQVGWRNKLEARAQALGVSERIHWPGMLVGEAKWGALRDAEAFVLPSHQENFGIVVAEAMAAGKPVLITNKVNIWQEVASSGSGLVESDDAEGILRLFKRYLALSPADRAAMGAQARSTFLERFEVKKAVTSINLALMEASQ